MKILYDTDFLIAFFVQNEPTHQKALALDKRSDSEEFYMTNLVHFEMATVLSRKFTHEFTKKILVSLSAAPINYIDLSEEEEEEVWKEFYSQKKKSISFIDCANLVIARKNNLKIASFDAFYPRNILL